MPTTAWLNFMVHRSNRLRNTSLRGQCLCVVIMASDPSRKFTRSLWLLEQRRQYSPELELRFISLVRVKTQLSSTPCGAIYSMLLLCPRFGLCWYLKPNSITLSGSNQLQTSFEPAPNQVA